MISSGRSAIPPDLALDAQLFHDPIHLSRQRPDMLGKLLAGLRQSSGRVGSLTNTLTSSI